MLIFIGLMVISVLIGFFMGGIATGLASSESIVEKFALLKDNVIRITPYVALLLNLILCVIGFCMYAKNKKMSDAWDGEDEKIIDQIETRQSIALVISSIMMVLNFLFFGVGFAVDAHLKEGLTIENIGLIIGFLTFIFSFVWEMILQGQVIALEKKLNPEKRGNILDMKFRKEWIESCDEAERMNIYRTAYDVYKFMSNLFIYAWLLTFIVSAATGTGLFAMVMVALLWLIQTAAYFKAAAKYQ